LGRPIVEAESGVGSIDSMSKPEGDHALGVPDVTLVDRAGGPATKPVLPDREMPAAAVVEMSLDVMAARWAAEMEQPAGQGQSGHEANHTNLLGALRRDFNFKRPRKSSVAGAKAEGPLSSPQLNPLSGHAT
jgi:hypothetical protein